VLPVWLLQPHSCSSCDSEQLEHFRSLISVTACWRISCSVVSLLSFDFVASEITLFADRCSTYFHLLLHIRFHGLLVLHLQHHSILRPLFGAEDDAGDDNGPGGSSE
jgi:hypothetical protein